MPPGVYDALKCEAAASFDHIEALMPQLPRDADYRRSGRVVCAALPNHYTAMQAKSGKMTKDGTQLYPKNQQRLVIGTDLYHGVMTIDRAGQLHPGKYVQGLVDLAASEGAVLCDHHRVSGISRAGTSWRVAAGNARVDCEKVFIATNGYSDTLRPWMRRRVIPAASYIVVTDELPDGLIDDLLPQGRTAVDSKRLLSYFRPTPDRKRILFGGRASLQERPAQEVACELAARLYAVFPQITGLPIRYAWSGNCLLYTSPSPRD